MESKADEIKQKEDEVKEAEQAAEKNAEEVIISAFQAIKLVRNVGILTFLKDEKGIIVKSNTEVPNLFQVNMVEQ